MFLTFEQLKNITFGANYAEHTEHGVEFFRMSKQQAARFDFNADFFMKTFATSGIFLDFYTDSAFFSFAFDNVKQASSRTWCLFSLLMDGKTATVLGEEKPVDKKFEYRVELPEGTHRITLFFPCLSRARLVFVELSDGASVSAAKKKATWLFLGDSITHGYDAKSPANAYHNRLAMLADVQVRNQGIGGAFFDARTIDDLPEDTDAVFVAYGTNDYSAKSPDIFTRDCTDYFEKLATMYATKPIFAILPIWRQDYKNGGNAGDFLESRKLIATIASAHKNVHVIDTWGFIPEDIRFFSDGIHPNDEGFRYYAEGVLSALKTIHLEDMGL